ncbi:AAA family ATPase [uncultured Thiothrix sp.]|uniref:AAA family ATPase n=1 Tax=uncultured Thiothrix sp. TaxID=223185 RepID=UPI0026137A17|nr:ATP-binding protein [uncultured Thiothrix sp.]HMT93257.1 AAA family ATPase [Thiolinea sp.]
MGELARVPYRLEGLELFQVGVFEKVRFDFKPIETLEADAKKAEIHLLTGPNGSGKSTVLYAISDIFKDTRNSAPDSFITAHRFRSDSAYVLFNFEGENGFFALKVEGADFIENYDIFRWRNDVCLGFQKSRQNHSLDFYRAAKNNYHLTNKSKYNFAVFAYSGSRSLKQFDINSIKSIDNSPFENSLSFDQSVRPELILQWIANNRTQYALALADRDKDEASKYEFSLRRISDFIKDICDLNFEFKLERNPLQVSLKINEVAFAFDGLPDGLKSIISWVADLSLRLESIPWADQDKDAFSQPIILLLDEIDIHLHPKWQRRILPAVQKLLPNAQIFASTHSPFVVGSVEDAWVYRLPEANQKPTSGIIEGIPSAAGKSYQLILEEIFGVSEEFDIETEQLFADFYKERDLVIKNKQISDKFLEIAKKVSSRGEEAQFIIERELRQVSRLISQEIILA